MEYFLCSWTFWSIPKDWPVLTFVVFIATPSGRFLWMYSRKVSAVEPVSLWNCIKWKYVLNSYCTRHFLFTWIDLNTVYLSWWGFSGVQLKEQQTINCHQTCCVLTKKTCLYWHTYTLNIISFYNLFLDYLSFVIHFLIFRLFLKPLWHADTQCVKKLKGLLWNFLSKHAQHLHYYE